MPSLFRFLTVVAVIAGVVYGAIFALANFVTPKPREMTINVPPDKFLKKERRETDLSKRGFVKHLRVRVCRCPPNRLTPS